MTIPSQALQKSLGGNKAIVYLLNKSNAIEEREVTVGINNNINVEIKSGIKEGDTVVVSSANGASLGNNTKGPRIRF